MQERIARHVLKDLRQRGWGNGCLKELRRGVSGIVITSPDGQNHEFATVDEVRIAVKNLADSETKRRL
jgi:hypothetical protein